MGFEESYSKQVGKLSYLFSVVKIVKWKDQNVFAEILSPIFIFDQFGQQWKLKWNALPTTFRQSLLYWNGIWPNRFASKLKSSQSWFVNHNSGLKKTIFALIL